MGLTKLERRYKEEIKRLQDLMQKIEDDIRNECYESQKRQGDFNSEGLRKALRIMDDHLKDEKWFVKKVG